jgi:hypothetical protein
MLKRQSSQALGARSRWITTATVQVLGSDAGVSAMGRAV